MTNHGPEMAQTIKAHNINQILKMGNCGFCSFWKKISHFGKKARRVSRRFTQMEIRRFPQRFTINRL